jgi:hypothetical protein
VKGQDYDPRVESLRVGQVVRCRYDNAAGSERTIAELTKTAADGRHFGSGRGVRLEPVAPCAHCGAEAQAVTGWIDAAWCLAAKEGA